MVHSSRWGIEPADFDQKIVFTSVFKYPPHSFILWPRSFVLFHGLFLQFIAYGIPLRTSFVTLSYDGRDHAIKEFINLDRSSPLAHPFADVLYIVYLALCLFTQLSQLSIIVCSFKSYLIQYRLSRGVLHWFRGTKGGPSGAPNALTSNGRNSLFTIPNFRLEQCPLDVNTLLCSSEAITLPKMLLH